MPISPLHLGPGILQKAVAPKLTDLRLYVVTTLAIDAEPIFKGVTDMLGMARFDVLHTWTHTPAGVTLIALSCALAWALSGLSSRWTALSTAAGAGLTHWLLDSLMHGGADMPSIMETHGYGSDLAHGIAIWCFLIGGSMLLVNHFGLVLDWLKRELGGKT